MALRRSLLSELSDPPVVLETHGGWGHVYGQLYYRLPPGVVFEKDPEKAAALARQRPTWAVYEADCETAIAAGAVDDWPFTFIDLDPYGEPWPAMDALFSRRDRDWPAALAIAVNDGLRQGIKMGGGWNVASLAGPIERHGNAGLYASYLDVARELLQEKAGQVGYTLARWAGYYCGHAQQMTHYAAILRR